MLTQDDSGEGLTPDTFSELGFIQKLKQQIKLGSTMSDHFVEKEYEKELKK